MCNSRGAVLFDMLVEVVGACKPDGSMKDVRSVSLVAVVLLGCVIEAANVPKMYGRISEVRVAACEIVSSLIAALKLIVTAEVIIVPKDAGEMLEPNDSKLRLASVVAMITAEDRVAELNTVTSVFDVLLMDDTLR